MGCKRQDQGLPFYLLLLNPVLNLFGGRLMRSEQVDGAGKLRVQYVSIFVSDHQIEIQVPCVKMALNGSPPRWKQYNCILKETR